VAGNFLKLANTLASPWENQKKKKRKWLRAKWGTEVKKNERKES